MVGQTSKETQVTEIGTHERTVLGDTICYKLFWDEREGQVGYWISICRGEEQAEGFLGEDFLSVAVLFTEIVRGEVLPYSLAEIVEDYRGGEKFYGEKSL